MPNARETKETPDPVGNLTVLLIEDSETDAVTTKRVLERQMQKNDHQCRLLHAESMSDAETILKTAGVTPDIILLDLGLPDTADNADTYSKLSKILADIEEDMPVLVLTSVKDHALALEMVGLGAEDFVRKDSITTNPHLLCNAVAFAICRHRNLSDMRENAARESAEKDQIIGWMSGNYSC